MSNQPGGEPEPENIPTSYNTPPPPPSYEQPAFYQQPQYAQPSINVPGQPSYNASIPPYEQIPYDYQQSRYSNAFPSFPPSNPLSLGDAIRQLPAQYWRVFTRPRVATFDAEQGKAAWNIIWVQIIVLTIFRIILLALHALESSSLSRPLGNNTLDFIVRNTSGLSVGSIIFSLFSFPVLFFITTGIYFLIAKAFQGQGTFLRYLYCTLLITIPFNIVLGLVGLLHVETILLDLINLVLLTYQIILLVFMTMAVHRLSGGKATLAVIILPIIVFVLAIIAVIIIVAAITRSHSY